MKASTLQFANCHPPTVNWSLLTFNIEPSTFNYPEPFIINPLRHLTDLLILL